MKSANAPRLSAGLVFLPGMMAGQILGGGKPWLAAKYPVAIMRRIFASTPGQHPQPEAQPGHRFRRVPTHSCHRHNVCE